MGMVLTEPVGAAPEATPGALTELSGIVAGVAGVAGLVTTVTGSPDRDADSVDVPGC